MMKDLVLQLHHDVCDYDYDYFFDCVCDYVFYVPCI
jgi:hypothetical protein